MKPRKLSGPSRRGLIVGVAAAPLLAGCAPPAQGDDQRSEDAAARVMTPPWSRAPRAGAPTFAVSGTLGCARTTAPDELTLAIASPPDQSSAPHRIAWVVCIARDQALTAASALRSGDHIRVEGYIEPRRRRVGRLVFYSVVFIAKTIERVSTISDICARVVDATVLARAKGERSASGRSTSGDTKNSRFVNLLGPNAALV